MTISYKSAAKTACEAAEWSLSNLELHKLLYLAHMKFLGETDGEPLVDANFEAWKYGPVIAPLYHFVKPYGSRKIPDIFLVDRNLKRPEHKTIRKVIEEFGHLSAGELVEITHEAGGAWDTNYDPDAYGVIIPDSEILDEYRRLPF